MGFQLIYALCFNPAVRCFENGEEIIAIQFSSIDWIVLTLWLQTKKTNNGTFFNKLEANELVATIRNWSCFPKNKNRIAF